MPLTPNEIESQKFDRRLRGYDRAQVASFQSAVAEEIARLTAERNLLQEEKADLERRLEEFRGREKAIQETLFTLRDLTNRMKDEAQREAELTQREARMKADQLLEQARAEAARIEGQISELRVERDTFEDRLRLLIDEHQRLLIQRRQRPEWSDPIRFVHPPTVESEQ